MKRSYAPDTAFCIIRWIRHIAFSKKVQVHDEVHPHCRKYLAIMKKA